MQTFSVLSIKVIGGAEKCNEVSIVAQEMYFWDVEVILNAEINEDIFIDMEAIECVLH